MGAIANIAHEVIPLKSGLALRALARTPRGQRSAKQAITVARSRSQITPAFLAAVTDVYRDNQDRAVEKAFGVAHCTAAHYVELAREAKLLPPTTQGRKQI
jgi:hypothetical protein